MRKTRNTFLSVPISKKISLEQPFGNYRLFDNTCTEPPRMQFVILMNTTESQSSKLQEKIKKIHTTYFFKEFLSCNNYCTRLHLTSTPFSILALLV